MRILLALLILVAGLATAQAQVRVDSVDVLAAGIFKLESKPKRTANSEISSGEINEADATLISRTAVIPAKLGTAFGVDLMIRGAPPGHMAPFRVVWRYPQPGLLNPNTGKTTLVDDYIDNRILGAESKLYWILGAEWALVPGTWTFEIWYEDRMLASQSFTLTK